MMNRVAAAVVTAIAFSGAGTSAAFADTGSTATRATAVPANAQADQALSFYNQAANGMLDFYCSGPQGPFTWPIAPGVCQQWRLDNGTEGSLIESIARPGWCITAPEEIGQQATNQPCSPADPAQQWDFPQVGNKYYIAEASEGQFVLASTGNLAPLQLQLATNSEWQKWAATPPA